jgi:hypothetical protein
MSYEITDYEIDYVKGYEAKVALVIDGVWKDCYIDFTASFDDDIPLVSISYVWLQDMNCILELPQDIQFNLEEEIAIWGNDIEWRADLEASYSDYYYDMYKGS